MGDSQTPKKHCFNCGTTKPVAEFSRSSARADGRQTQCKTCQCASRKAHRAANADADKARTAAYYLANKSALSKKRKQYPSQSVDAVRARSAKHYQTNRDAVLAQAALRYQRNRTKILAQCAARFHENRSAWYAKTRKYVAQKLAAVPGWADPARTAYVYAKAQELSAAFGVDFEVDHVVPLKSSRVCGLHTEDNLQLLATDINRSKGNRYWPDMPE